MLIHDAGRTRNLSAALPASSPARPDTAGENDHVTLTSASDLVTRALQDYRKLAFEERDARADEIMTVCLRQVAAMPQATPAEREIAALGLRLGRGLKGIKREIAYSAVEHEIRTPSSTETGPRLASVGWNAFPWYCNTSTGYRLSHHCAKATLRAIVDSPSATPVDKAKAWEGLRFGGLFIDKEDRWSREYWTVHGLASREASMLGYT